MTAAPAQSIAYPAPGSRPSRREAEHLDPHVIVLFGATGDLSRRKLLPGLTHLALSSLTPDVQVVATSLEDMDSEAFRHFAHQAVTEFSTRPLDEDAVGDLRQQAALCPAERRPGGAGRRGRRGRSWNSATTCCACTT